ncbi:MAG: glycine cleavage system protein GcvH [Candidatus Gygaella obscura]|nr:glycine cleavage system protein GcvH [Candidatus Gygaella obscura]
MDVRDGLYYSKEHEWVKLDNKIAIIGITDYAQSALGDVTFVELPKPGESFKQSQQIATVESVKAASDVYVPISGVVKEVNLELDNTPELVNQSCYEKGFFLKMQVEDETEVKNLMDSASYKAYLEGLSK